MFSFSLIRDVEYRVKGRLRLVEQASVELSDIRTSDEGWYQCSVIFITSRGDPENSPYDTWIYLAVHCEYLDTPDCVNITLLEHVT